MKLILFILGIIMFLIAAAINIWKKKEYDDAVNAWHDENRFEKEKKPKPVRTFPKASVLYILLGIALIASTSCFTIIPTGYTGVITTFGQIESESLMPGFHWKTPIAQTVSTVNNKLQDRTYEGQAWSETNDETVMYMENVTVTYQIVPESSAWIYANVEDWVENLVNGDLVSSALKAAARKQDTDKVMDRAVLEPACQEELQNAVDMKYGKDRIRICKVVVGNADFEDTYNEAIAERSKAMQKQKQEAIEKETALNNAKADAERAKIEADTAREKARGQADAEVIRAEGMAKANNILQQSITDKTLKHTAIEKWDGKLPKYTAGEGDATFGIIESVGAEITESTKPATTTESAQPAETAN